MDAIANYFTFEIACFNSPLLFEGALSGEPLFLFKGELSGEPLFLFKGEFNYLERGDDHGCTQHEIQTAVPAVKAISIITG